MRFLPRLILFHAAFAAKDRAQQNTTNFYDPVIRRFCIANDRVIRRVCKISSMQTPLMTGSLEGFAPHVDVRNMCLSTASALSMAFFLRCKQRLHMASQFLHQSNLIFFNDQHQHLISRCLQCKNILASTGITAFVNDNMALVCQTIQTRTASF